MRYKIELKINGIEGPIILFGVYIFIFIISLINSSVNRYLIIMYLEIIVPMLTAILCTFIIYKNNEIDLVLAYSRSVFKTILYKYVCIVVTTIFICIIELLLFQCYFKSISVIILLYALASPTLILSSLAVLITIIARNTSIGSSFTGVLAALQIGIGVRLSETPSHPWYEIFGFYNTFYKFKSNLWIINRWFLILLSIFIWAVILTYVNKRSRLLSD